MSSTPEPTNCPDWCILHIDGEHVGLDITTVRYSVPFEKWEQMDAGFRERFNEREYRKMLAGTSSKQGDDAAIGR